MKKIICLFLFTILIITACDHKEEMIYPEESNLSNPYEKLINSNDPMVQSLLLNSGYAVADKGRITNARGEDFRIDPDSVLKIMQKDSSSYSYTIQIESRKDSTYYDNLVYTRYNDEYYLGFILRYYPMENSDLSNGMIERYDLEGNWLREYKLIDNEGIASSIKNGKTYRECTEVITLEEEYICPDGQTYDTSTATGLSLDWLKENCEEVTVVVISYDCGGTSGGGSGDGSDTGGTLIPNPEPPGGGGTSGTTSGSETTDSGDDGSDGGTDQSDPSVEGGGTTIGVLPKPTLIMEELYTSLNLTSEEENYLKDNPALEYEVAQFLHSQSYSLEATGFVEFALENIIYNEPGADVAFENTITIANDNSLSGPYNEDYYQTINGYYASNLIDPALQAVFMNYFSTHCAILKIQHPEWSDYRIYYEATKEMIHIALDIGGLVPGVGEVCDIANGLIYTLEGDGVNASLSFAAAVPVAGWFATGAKFAYKGSLKFVVKANGLIDFGSRSDKLRKALGLVKGDGKHAHHIIPWNLRFTDAVQKAAKSKKAFHIDEVLNGIPLPSADHLTGHSKYYNVIEIKLDEIKQQNLGLEETYREVLELIEHIKNVIKNNPGKNLGEIADLI